jgi:membrane-bound ClpP family serine protease
MFKVTVLLLLGVLLLILCAIFIFRNFLSQYRMSRSGFLTVLIVFLMLSALLSTLIICAGAMGLQKDIHYLNTVSNIPKDEFDMLTKAIPSGINQIIKLLIIGYGSYICDFAIVRIIDKKMQNNADRYAGKRWKLKQ